MINRGSAFLLKHGTPGATENQPPVYSTLAGLRTTSMSLEPGKMTISAAGIFLGSAAESTARSLALTGALFPAELSFEDGTKYHGSFLITRLDYNGDFNGERNYAVAMEGSVEAYEG